VVPAAGPVHRRDRRRACAAELRHRRVRQPASAVGGRACPRHEEEGARRHQRCDRRPRPPALDREPVTMDPYLNPELPVADRVADLLDRMTVEEKGGQIMQRDARDGVQEHILDKHVGSILHPSPERVREAHDVTARTRLRIPLLVGEDVIHGHSFYEGATIYPTQLGMAASWDAELIERMARATAVEASATGMHWTFSPVLCIARDLRWGRVDETFGEDPFLIGELASAMGRGYQGDGLTD